MYRNSLIFLFLIILFIPAFGEDSIVAENRFVHEIENGKPTSRKRAYEQATFDKYEKILLLVRYDSLSGIKSYVNYFYNDSLLISEEEYSAKNDIKSVIRFAYNNDGRLIEKKLYYPDGDRMKLSAAIYYSYHDSLLTGEIVKNSAGKVIGNTSYSYTKEQKTVLSEYKKVTGNSDIKKLSSVATLKEGKIISEKILREYYDKSIRSTTVKYTYDDFNRIIVEDYYNELDELTEKIKYSYRKNGRMNTKAIMDANNTPIEFYTFARKEFVIRMGDKAMTDLEKPLEKKEFSVPVLE